MAIVYAWPPVSVQSWKWAEFAPLNTSVSPDTGKRYASTTGRARIVAGFSVSALGSQDRAGAGYMQSLVRLLDGGANYVRLTAPADNWWMDELEARPWVPVSMMATATTDQGLNAFIVSNVPSGFLLLRSGDRFTVNGQSYLAVNRVVGRADRTALIRVTDAAISGGALTLGGEETRVFAVTQMPDTAQSYSGDWVYDWAFSEVFEDEVGSFEERNPWT